ncbi:MAG: hypothetical protein FWG97_01750 [Deltaproteobacteria bacterium]|nr:hypothetical protein [Deltaproteobacteria bacterium]
MPGLLVFGLAALVVGLILFFAWLEAVLILVKATAALGFLGTGAVAIYLGWEELRDLKKTPLDFSCPAEADRYQAEATAYQAKLDEISREGSDPPANVKE